MVSHDAVRSLSLIWQMHLEREVPSGGRARIGRTQSKWQGQRAGRKGGCKVGGKKNECDAAKPNELEERIIAFGIQTALIGESVV